jgi:hypothetical membrane protein
MADRRKIARVASTIIFIIVFGSMMLVGIGRLIYAAIEAPWAVGLVAIFFLMLFVATRLAKYGNDQ